MPRTRAPAGVTASSRDRRSDGFPAKRPGWRGVSGTLAGVMERMPPYLRRRWITALVFLALAVAVFVTAQVMRGGNPGG